MADSIFQKFSALRSQLKKEGREDFWNCLFLLTGSRENLYQLFVITRVLGLRPLTVTFDPENGSLLEEYQRQEALKVFDVDNITFHPRKSVFSRLPAAEASRAGNLWLMLFLAENYGLPDIFWDSAALPARGKGISSFDSGEQSRLAREFELEKMLGEFPVSLDRKPYRFDRVKLTSPKTIYSLREMPEWNAADAAALDSLFTWKTEAELQKESAEREAANKKLWHERNGKRPVTLEKQAPRAPSPWEKLAAESKEGKPLYHGKLRYCLRCCMPETAESLAFDEMGMCQPCRSSEQKMHINWNEREEKLRELLEEYRSKDGENYDCIVPISGGKDSTFQVYVLTKRYGLKPLAVTFSHNWYTHTGKKNLQNAYDRFDIDHVIFTPRAAVINKLARKSLPLIGDSCWHCHAGVGAFPLQAAARFQVGLLIWGESVAENHGRATYAKPILFDRDYFTKISARFYAEQLVDGDLSSYDVQPYVLPTHEQMEAGNVRGIHLGNYIFWDDERQTEFVRDFWGWLEDDVEGAYKGFKSVECRMAGVHDYSKFIKRGFGRGTDQASLDVRAGLMTREEGFEMAKRYDSERPAALDFYLQITGYTEEEFEKILKEKRDGKAKNLP